MNRTAYLQAYIVKTRKKKFRPGNHDCAIWVAEWVRLLTNKNLTHGLEGRYRTLQQGRDALLELGFTSHIEIAKRHFKQIATAMANVGDLMVLNDESFGICTGEDIAVLKPSGIGIVPRSQALMAFEI